jgi:hypothetical protein
MAGHSGNHRKAKQRRMRRTVNSQKSSSSSSSSRSSPSYVRTLKTQSTCARVLIIARSPRLSCGDRAGHRNRAWFGCEFANRHLRRRRGWLGRGVLFENVIAWYVIRDSRLYQSQTVSKSYRMILTFINRRSKLSPLGQDKRPL